MNPRILLVEDDPTSRAFLQAATEALPACVDVAATMADAKTSSLAKMAKELGWKRVLIIDGAELDGNFVLAARNMMSGQSRLIMWVWYAAVTALAMGAAYLFTMIDARAAANLLAVFWQYAVTVALYPLADGLIERFEDADVRFR